MNPLPHPRCTHSFGAPPTWDEKTQGPCGVLEIALVNCNSESALESLWRPTPEELDALNRGGAVVLTIYGTKHPVVAIGAAGPEHLVAPES